MSYEIKDEIFRMNKQLCRFSNDGRFLALANQNDLIIKLTDTLITYNKYIFTDIIEGFEWSPNSEYILCYNIKRSIVQIFSIYFPDWKFKLTEGSIGLEYAFWTPDSKHIVTVADLKIQLSIWSLVDHSVHFIKNLKSSIKNGFSFSPDGESLAVTTTSDDKDTIDVYKTEDWKISQKLICDGLKSIDGFSWSPDSQLMCIWCGISGLAKLIVHSNVKKSHVGIFYPDDSKNNELLKFNVEDSSNENLRGLEVIRWMPSGQLLTIAGHNETIVFLNCLTWTPLLQLRLEPVVKGNNYLARIFKECIAKEFRKSSSQLSGKSFSLNDKHTLEEIGDRPFNLPIAKEEFIIGGNVATTISYVIDIFEYSNCGQYLAVRHQIYPYCLWIWDIRTNGCDILILQNSVCNVKWNPIKPKLLAFTESPYIFEWTPDEVSCFNSPKGMAVLDVQWHPLGDLAVLCGHNKGLVYRNL